MNRQELIEIEDFLSENASTYECVVIFGSYARGESYSSSDLDLLLLDERFNDWSVYEVEYPKSLSFEWRGSFPPLHLICCSKYEFKSRYCENENMVMNIVEEGYDPVESFRFVDYVESIQCS